MLTILLIDMNGKYLSVESMKDIITNYLLEESSQEYVTCRTKLGMIRCIIENGRKDNPVACREIYHDLVAKKVIREEEVSKTQICGILGSTANKLRRFISGKPGGFYFWTDIYRPEEKSELLEFLDNYRCPGDP